MKVLLTADAMGGVWTYAMTLMRSLIEQGDGCLLAVLGEPSDAQVAAIPAGGEWERASHRLEWNRASEQDVRAGTAWLEGLARRWRPDVVHLNQFAYATGEYGAPSLVVAHSDVFSWHAEVRGEAPGAAWSSYRRWVRAGLEAADAVVAPTRYQSALLSRHYGQGADRVIHNGMAAPSADERLRASQRASVLAAGRAWDEAKCVAVLDEALERLGDRAPSAHLAGPLEGPAGERFSPRKLHAHGRLPREAMGRLYDNAMIFVAPSCYEPFGLAPLEAAMHGCALILTDIGSFHELWEGAAEFVPVRDPVRLGEVLLALREDPARMDALAAAARSRAMERYTVARMMDGYRALYADLVSPDDGASDACRSA